MGVKQVKGVIIAAAISLAAVFVGVNTLPDGKEADLPVEFSWGIPADVQVFEGAVTEPQGEEVKWDNENHLELTWEKGRSYVLPFSAFSEEELKGVRYTGAGIPADFNLEWKDPWEETWFSFKDLPEEKIKAEIKEEDGFLTIDFGPPGGADFEEGLTRVAWFRITPTETKQFELTVSGYKPFEGNEEKAVVTNLLSAEIKVVGN